ncbi:hypothetical protein E2C01_038210 [Portunus trituberculatus]|uniref:Uncharacterized protein n=1 Tax=Portunus trituberculatus TaxID=210409 RepID=A0A5B7FGN1_PORTR|nr:hypothetical protein [Portunus trituberculatus]
MDVEYRHRRRSPTNNHLSRHGGGLLRAGLGRAAPLPRPPHF